MYCEVKVANKLREARRLISDPDNWTRGAFARDKDDLPVSGSSPEARCFCALGVLKKVIPGCTASVASINMMFSYLRQAQKQLDPGCESISNFNDTHEHQDVLKMYDKAILMALGNEE